MADTTQEILAEQLAYYRARAPEYDEWWQRSGRYDEGPEATSKWVAEVDQLEAWVRSLGLCGSVVELACGTGWWTRRLAAIATDLTCVDASPEVLELNRRRLAEAGLARPTYIQADLFDWEPPGVFDAAFFSFWISHAPLDRFDAFWTSVASLLKPGGRAVFIDNAHRDESAAPHDRETQGRRDELQERRLNDGRVFQVVKLCHEPDALTLRLDKLGWTAEAKVTPTYFLFGHATRDR